ncbi:hypothetical protein AB0M39_11735 [Streptomyces sp. NPDC051907]|uniref:hypothetical protein n=1 Tax=Streptomyces sp. NPDC051907 TaxID=3155284 RepID=UPI00343B0208
MGVSAAPESGSGLVQAATEQPSGRGASEQGAKGYEPLPSDADAVADRITAFAEARNLPASADVLLARVVTALRTGEHAEGWSRVDLLGLVEQAAGPGAESGEGSPTRRGLRELAPSLLVFLPLCVTWGFLALATAAYQEMLNDPAGRQKAEGRSFLELWQAGFDGRLAAAASFHYVAYYTLAAIGFLVAALWWSWHAGRRDEHRDDAQLAELAGLLTQAQFLLAQTAHGAAARVAQDTERAAARISGMAQDLVRVQQATAQAAKKAGELLGTAKDAAAEITAAARELHNASADTRDALGVLARSADELGERGTELCQAGRESADAVAAAVRQTADSAGEQLRKVADSAGEQVRQVAGLAAQVVRQAGDEAAGAVQVAGQPMLTASEALTEQAAALARADERLAESVRLIVEEGAERFGETYRLAVAAAAVELSARIAEAGEETGRRLAEVSERMGQVRDTTRQHAEGLQDMADERRQAVRELLRTAGELRDVLALAARDLRGAAASATETQAGEAPATAIPPAGAYGEPDPTQTLRMEAEPTVAPAENGSDGLSTDTPSDGAEHTSDETPADDAFPLAPPVGKVQP